MIFHSRYVLFVGIVMLCIFGRPPEARALLATCSIGNGTIAFSGLDILGGAPVGGQTTLSLTCDFVLSVSSISVCIGINEGTGGAAGNVRHLVNGVQKIDYQLYSDAAYQSPLGPSSNSALGNMVAVSVSAPSLLGGSTTVSIPIFGRVNGSQTQVGTGSYVSTLTVTAQYPTINAPVISDCGILGNYAPTTTTSTLTAQATIDKNCLVNTSALDFGNHGTLTSNIDATGRVNVTCTNTTPYSIGLDLGGFTATTRRMTNGTDYVVYGLYQDAAYQTPWGEAAGNQAKAGTGTGLTESHIVYGRVLPQTTPPAKTYTDSVAVTVTY